MISTNSVTMRALKCISRHYANRVQIAINSSFTRTDIAADAALRSTTSSSEQLTQLGQPPTHSFLVSNSSRIALPPFRLIHCPQLSISLSSCCQSAILLSTDGKTQSITSQMHAKLQPNTTPVPLQQAMQPQYSVVSLCLRPCQQPGAAIVQIEELWPPQFSGTDSCCLPKGRPTHSSYFLHLFWRVI